MTQPSLRERLFGKTTSKEFSFKDIVITLRALTEKENTEVWSKASPTAPATSVRVPMLARAVVRLDDYAVEQHPDLLEAVRASRKGSTFGPSETDPVSRSEILPVLEAWLNDLSVPEVDQLFSFYGEVEQADKTSLATTQKKA